MNKNGHIFHLLFYSLTHSVPYTCTTPQTQKTYWYEPYIKCEGWTKRIAAGVREDFMVIIPQKTLRWVYRFCRCQRRCRLFPLAGVWPHQISPPRTIFLATYLIGAKSRLERCGAKSRWETRLLKCEGQTDLKTAEGVWERENGLLFLSSCKL